MPQSTSLILNILVPADQKFELCVHAGSQSQSVPEFLKWNMKVQQAEACICTTESKISRGFRQQERKVEAVLNDDRYDM